MWNTKNLQVAALILAMLYGCSCNNSATNESDNAKSSSIDSTNVEPADNTGNRNGTSTELMDTMLPGAQTDSSSLVK